MTCKKIFVDSDTLLDFLLDRRPFADYSEILLNKAKQGVINLYTSTLITANIYYIVARNINKKEAKAAIKGIINFARLLSFDETHIKQAINSEHPDFEDAIQYYIAQHNDCDLIISRNIRHYKRFDIPVLTAEQYLRTIL